MHDEFEVRGSPTPAEAVLVGVAEGDGPRGLARYRNAAMVGAGGLACAAVGAFLGGIGGSITIAPAAAHPLASSVSQDGTPVAGATGGGAATASSTAAVVTAALTSLSGSLTQNAAPLRWLTAQSGTASATLVGRVRLLHHDRSGARLRPEQRDDRARECRHAAERPDRGTEHLRTFADRRDRDAGEPDLAPADFLAPAARGRHPVAGPARDRGGPRSGRARGLGGLGASGSGLPGSSGATSLLSDRGGIAALVDGVTGAVTGATGSGSPSPSLPIGGSGGSVPGLRRVPGLPVTASAGGTASTPTGSASGGASTGGTTKTSTSGATTTTTPRTTTVTGPLPSLPLPLSAPPVTIGGVSVGVSNPGSGSGLTLSLP